MKVLEVHFIISVISVTLGIIGSVPFIFNQVGVSGRA